MARAIHRRLRSARGAALREPGPVGAARLSARAGARTACARWPLRLGVLSLARPGGLRAHRARPEPCGRHARTARAAAGGCPARTDDLLAGARCEGGERTPARRAQRGARVPVPAGDQGVGRSLRAGARAPGADHAAHGAGVAVGDRDAESRHAAVGDGGVRPGRRCQ